jgi:ribonuclease R
MPGLTLPMLPEPISAGAASLAPGQERAAVSVLATLDADCRLRSWELVRSLIRSRRRLTYDEAAGLLDDGAERPDGGTASDDWRQVLVRAHRVARRLRARRLERGGLHLSSPDFAVELDAAGMPVAITAQRDDESHHLVEEHMLLANELVGSWGKEAALPILYRVHERPRWERLLALGLVLEEMGLRTGQRDLGKPHNLAAVMAEGQERGLGELVAMHLLRALEKARYDAEDCGHYGLGVHGYCHFTSPIRRYPDLHTHRVLLAAVAALGGGDAAARESARAERRLRPVRGAYGAQAVELAEHTSGRELDAQRAERLALKVKLLRMLAPRLGEIESGRIATVTGAGMGVLLDDYPIEGWVSLERLPGDFYRLGSRGQSLEGRRHGAVFAVGQQVRARLERVSVVERELELALVGRADPS